MKKFSEYSKDEVQQLLEDFIRKNNPEKLKFNPKVISYNDDILLFGMWKHYGSLSISTSKLLAEK